MAIVPPGKITQTEDRVIYAQRESILMRVEERVRLIVLAQRDT